MKRGPAVALVLLATLCALCQAVVPSAAFVDWSYTNCQADAICAEAMPSGADPAIFGEMLQYYIDHRQDAGIGIVSLVEPCVQLILPPDDGLCASTDCAGYQQLWLGMMREARICEPNEEWIEGHGCHCIEGRICGDGVFDRNHRVDAFIALMVTLTVLIIAEAMFEEGRRSRIMWKLAAQVAAMARMNYERRVVLAMSTQAPAPPLLVVRAPEQPNAFEMQTRRP